MKNRIMESYFDNEVDELEQKGLLKTMTKDEWEDMKKDCDKLGTASWDGSTLYVGDSDYFWDCTSIDNVVIEIYPDLLYYYIQDEYDYEVEEGNINPDEVSEDDYWDEFITSAELSNYEDEIFYCAFEIPDAVQVYEIVD